MAAPSGIGDRCAMEATSEPGPVDDWLAGAMIEFGGEIEERADVPLEGMVFDGSAVDGDEPALA
jgi:hypothetical protein